MRGDCVWVGSVCMCVNEKVPAWRCKGGGRGEADSGSCWWGLMERLALRAVSSRADSFSGSICFISTEAAAEDAEGERRKQETNRDRR